MSLETATPPPPTAIRKSLFVDSTPLLGDPAALRARAREDGYLFFKQRLPADEVLALRAELLAVVERHGWRQPGQDALGGLVDYDAINRVTEEAMHRTDVGVTADAYHDVQKLERFHRLPHHPRLLEIYRALFDGEVLVHPRHIARMITPHTCMVPTPPHQDFPYIQGSANTWTCWFPVGDCPRPLGGLTVLHGSHRGGYQPVQPAKGAGGFAVPLCPHETHWVEGDYEVGDVLTFPCHTIHKALRCQFKDRIRLSLDVRYQAASEPVDNSSLNPHCSLTWDEIYAGWKHDDLKYYWRKLPLNVSPWDQGYLQPKRRIC
ncbi:phytanoyl-CoA dioxygenase family protein [Horticoccus luteus]|uniref:Phytanoyl-CoA dioxygenase family protein n=1 Tax=Horticoccus luteus TaxID=2862869 RepID=A0A8F9TYG4_9BACT|nr:phytanoyl-CoA dioxygenase family protein [Horticoccus luteus]QYM80316.1 phytanoyl-CoA dioxygenase family protein [Horticoccus luteus]